MIQDLCDAHCHLHDPRLDPWRSGMEAAMQAAGIGGAVVNGTGVHDWAAVAACCSGQDTMIPAYGVHPWRVREQPADWEKSLCAFLEADPRAGVGEIGLDQWIDHTPPAVQMPFFQRQWDIARERNLPATIHCVRAWEQLRQFCRRSAAPARGFLLHAYSGPAALVPFFADCGARFSYSTYFLHPRKSVAREAFRLVPPDRLLIETDAPDLAPPAELAPYALTDAGSGKPVNHPANLPLALRSLAGIRGMSEPDLAALVSANWHNLFAPP